MTDEEAKLREALRQPHYYCDDSWYSCPLAPEGCANDFQDKTKCQCGADEHNAQIDTLVAEFVAAVRAETLRGVRGKVEESETPPLTNLAPDALRVAFNDGWRAHTNAVLHSVLDALAQPEGTE